MAYTHIASPQKWSYSFIHTRNGTRGEKEGTESPGLIHGLLQSDTKLWRGETSEGLQRGWCQWLYRRRSAAGRSCVFQEFLYKGRVSHVSISLLEAFANWTIAVYHTSL